ncbi:response regulator transcription factor [Caproiciproducens galactitolivorans]|uniref:Stage 0 sporulation protein A homolog n=1 Tax=Caproiciproducens galactitolivorans TaxID=642589 RepID=A0ABT4BV23_9FIRM|nr:response regulator [Caproiciproducens galactitolivorans]MCY1713788.1 response regulator [Caproiciproducens galactitolivorans]
MEYSVLVVDDEAAILNGIKSLIDWKKLQITCVETALSGEEALKKIESRSFEMILTDIRMEGMSGLELIRRIKADGNTKSRFIVLSAYDEFSYAKEAMQLGIDNYILKPISNTELADTLQNSIKKMENDAVFYNQSTMDMLRINTLYRWCCDSLDESQFQLRKELFSITLEKPYYAVGLVLDKGGASRPVADDLRRIVPDTELYETFDERLCVIFSADSQTQIKEKIRGFDFELKELFEDHYRFLVGKTVSGYKQVSMSYSTISVMKPYLKFMKEKRLIVFDDFVGENAEIKLGREEYSPLSKAVIAMDKEQARKAIDCLMDKIRNMDLKPVEAYNYCLGIMLVFREVSEEYHLDIRDRYFDISGMLKQVQMQEDLGEFEKMLREEAGNIITSMELVKNAYPPIIKRMIEYTNENYAEDLTLRLLAEKFNVNANYLGSLFNSKVGQQYSDYLNRCRLVKAKAMLSQMDVKVNSIARMLGYKNPSYFYIRFKKFYGMSPNEFRNLIARGGLT